jgi:hypothetical protein
VNSLKISNIAKDISETELKKILCLDEIHSPLKQIRKKLEQNFLFAEYRKNTLFCKKNKETDFLGILESSLEINKNTFETIVANGYKESCTVGGGNYPIDGVLKIPDLTQTVLVASDLKCISYQGNNKNTTETSLSQNFGGSLDGEFFFSSEDIISLNENFDFSHIRLVQLNELLRDRIKVIYEKYKKVKFDFPEANRVIYLLLVKRGFDIFIIGLDLFPELNSYSYDELEKMDFNSLTSEIIFYNTKDLKKSLKGLKDKPFMQKKGKKVASSIVRFQYNPDLFSTIDYCATVCLYKSKKRIELTISKFTKTTVGVKINPDLHDTNSEFYKKALTYFEDKFDTRTDDGNENQFEKASQFLRDIKIHHDYIYTIDDNYKIKST